MKDMTTLAVGSSIAIIASIVIAAVVVVLVIYERYVYSEVRTSFIRSIQHDDEGGVYIVGFFHPRCSSGGGGERVLWKAVQAIGELKEGKLHTRDTTTTPTTHEPIIYSNDKLTNCKNVCVVIYTIDEPTIDYAQITIQNVQKQFAITISSTLRIRFVHLHVHKHLLFTKPTRFTMIVESWNTILLAYHALRQVNPHVYIDTTGYAFTFLIAKIFGNCKVGAYVHYPTISADMLSMIYDRRPSYNNDGYISTSAALTFVKLIYYCIFAVGYGLVGSLCCDLTMVNSSWTKGHIEQLWKLRSWFSLLGSSSSSSSSSKIHVIYPPVDTTQCVQTNNNINNERENIILSIGQFRPEKDHALQLHSFATFLTMYNKKDAMNDDDDSIQLVLIGSCRDDEDAYRVTRLKQLAKGLNIEQHVKFVINQPYSVIIDYLRRSSVGLHTMWNEHFGIGIVEMMAAGLVTIAHNSGGPMMDIILVPWDYTKTTEYKKNDCIPTGCLASTVDEYAKCMYEIFSRINKKKEKEEDDIISRIRDEGRRSAKRFSDEEFMNTFKETMLSSLLFESGSRDTIMTTTAYVMLVTMFVVFIAILIVLLKK